MRSRYIRAIKPYINQTKIYTSGEENRGSYYSGGICARLKTQSGRFKRYKHFPTKNRGDVQVLLDGLAWQLIEKQLKN